MTSDLDEYLARFAKLHVNKKAGISAPHKPILLLAVLEEVEQGRIINNQIHLTDQLSSAFARYWDTYVLGKGWLCQIAKPFRFMQYEEFWELIKDGHVVTADEIGDNPSRKRLGEQVDYAQFSPDLWKLLQDNTSRTALRNCLIEKYFPA